MKKISVVIVTYNRGNLLLECIKSVARQKYPRKKLEIIVVNDGSTDNTEKNAITLKGKNRNLRVLTHKENRGEAAARNTGIKAAKGEIIAFLDDDCIAHDGWLFSINSAFRKGIDGVEGKTFARGKKGPFDNYVENINGGNYMTCNMSYATSSIKSIGCDERLRYANRVDSDLAFSVLEKGGNLVFDENALTEHSVIKTGFMAKLRKKKFFMNDALLYKKHPRLYKKYIKYPFEKFTPFYILFILLSFLSPMMLLGVFLSAAIEAANRKWSLGILDYIKFTVLQAIGSFIIIASVIYGCYKYGASLKIFFPSFSS